MLSLLLVLGVIPLVCTDVISPNFVAPISEGLRKRTAIVPYSEYEKETEQRHRQIFSSTTAKPETDPVLLYLPPFDRARGDEIAGTNALSESFRPKTTQIAKNAEPRFQASRAQKYQRPTETEKPPFITPTSVVEQVPLLNNELDLEQPVYKNVQPAPFPPLSTKPSNNIVESIFTQSQSNLRHAPTSFAGLHSPVSPIQTGIAGSQPEALSPLTALLGGGSPLEQISKLARNLLSLPAGNKDLLTAMTKALGTGTAAEGSKLTSTAVGGLPKLGGEIGSLPDTLFSSAKDEEKNSTENATDSSLINITDPERLLAAAVAAGEVDASLINEANKTRKPSAKIVDWIQQNRPKQSVLTANDKLPYYGKYCGSLIENHKLGIYNVSGAVWALDNKRFLISKFHFKPTSSNDNVTFWAGPAKPSKTELDMVPTENGFYLSTDPVDIKTFMTQTVEEVEAKIRKDASVVRQAAEAEEEDGTSKNTVRRMKREGNSTIPLHFSTSSDDTNKVNLSITIPSNDSKDVFVPPKPLDWYAGVQPLLLTLPDQYTIKDIHWISVFDHNAHENAAMVLLSTDLEYQIPGLVTLRPFTPNGPYKISSGKIRLLNTKTIEIENFTLQTKGVPTWFMVGKDILPHKGGEILPVFNSSSNQFDCDSLRDYENETVSLRLPGSLNMKDVFWFSVFSITKTTSFAHIYLPYNDLQLPPDLLGVTAPRCVYKN
ncbi:unnamed protein product [Bursaphelenchus xylophilus]|uniref:(pine wood nematode) hypothetical protein n=1 Tax=Bursaphelenchus xylophilus TaxID=6326 RepID=A0A1I7SUI1_BURXY|nr:unnamed protein product [Bursaphelenchus xylophilus]CAG9107104.1 unnamed protein product [Bursaphelenchus xylophilus]